MGSTPESTDDSSLPKKKKVKFSKSEQSTIENPAENKKDLKKKNKNLKNNKVSKDKEDKISSNNDIKKKKSLKNKIVEKKNNLKEKIKVGKKAKDDEHSNDAEKK